MLAHTVIIITSGLAGKASPDALDRALVELTRNKKSPVLVLGADGDEILRTCQELEKAEIVFDPNLSGAFSPVKAGLHTTAAPAFIWSIDQKFPDPLVWKRLEDAIRTDEFPSPTIELLAVEGDASGLLLTTLNGTKRLKERAAADQWPDAPDLKIHRLQAFTSETGA